LAQHIKSLFVNLYNFYRYDCCWPYSVSFLLVLLIFAIENVYARSNIPWASYLSLIIISAYWLFNIKLYKKKALKTENPDFFIGWLSFKIILWSVIFVYINRLE